MLSVTAIGSCRVSNPLRIGRSMIGYRLNTDRIYGYSHSSSEAVQQMYFLQGEFTPLPELWPMISLGRDREKTLAQVHDSSDIYVVEISSAKSLSIGGHKVQLNYLRRRFAAFFEDKDRYRTFMGLCQSGRESAMSDFLETTWSATPEQREDSDILRHVRLELCTESALAKDLAELRDGLGNIMVVSHVNARLPDGKPLPTRSSFINDLTRVVRRMNIPFCDPTVLMNRVGQGKAIADNSTSLAHFTDEFSGMLVREWFDGPLGEMVENLVMDNPVDNIGRIILPLVLNILTTQADDRRDDMVDFLESIVTYWPENVAIRSALLDLAVTSQDNRATQRAFVQFLLNCDPEQVGKMPATAPHAAQLGGWCDELLANPNLTEEKRTQVTTFARRLGRASA